MISEQSLVILQHLEYESVEYLIAIQRHYKFNQIYKLSQDTKITIDRFLSSIQIHIGYSTILAWIAFFLSIIDGIFILATCKIKHKHRENETHDKLIPSNNEEIFRSIPNDSQSPSNIENEKSRIQFDENEV